MIQFQLIAQRLQKPSVILSIVSQVVAVMLLLGYQVDENLVMSVATIGCSILATLGIVSNPDTQKKGYGDDILTCSASGQSEPHVLVNGQMICRNCGAIYPGSNKTMEEEISEKMQ